MSGHERGSRTEEEEEEEEERRRSCVIKAEKTRQLLSAWRETSRVQAANSPTECSEVTGDVCDLTVVC